MSDPVAVAKGLLALAAANGSTLEEQRSAAHAAALLIAKHGLVLVQKQESRKVEELIVPDAPPVVSIWAAIGGLAGEAARRAAGVAPLIYRADRTCHCADCRRTLPKGSHVTKTGNRVRCLACSAMRARLQ